MPWLQIACRGGRLLLNQFKTPLASCAAAASRVQHGLPYAAERIRRRLYHFQREIELTAESIYSAFISPPVETGVFC
jgi:hypothetical protein